MANFDPRNAAPMSDPLQVHDEGGADPGASYVPEDDKRGMSRFIFFNAVPSWIVSLVFHFFLLIALALIGSPEEVSTDVREIIVQRPEEEQVEELQEIEIPLELEDVKELENMEEALEIAAVPDPTTDPVEMSMVDDLAAATIEQPLLDFSENMIDASNLMKGVGTVGEGIGDGRMNAKVKGKMLKEGGGSDATERAVGLALKWLAHHQLPDGGWNFDHSQGPGVRTSSNPGTMTQARNGATAMALLPFLGAGMTHTEGEYKETVGRGLQFLLQNGKLRGNALSFHEGGGSMYSHGLASICLCEAYAMTQDPALAKPAQFSLNFIVSAQDPIGGGWRYQPRQPGDTSAVGWQIMALKSGHLGYLEVPEPTIRGAIKFLDGVSSERGAFYGYTDPSPQKRPGTTSVGLLCRMYLGWKKDNAALMTGVKYLSGAGPAIDAKAQNGNMYYNYYGTQVMRQYGGPDWDKWNAKMSKALVDGQGQTGPEAGSWFVAGEHGSEAGGRLYSTALATMILEVYYRHMPIYQSQAAEQDFAL